MTDIESPLGKKSFPSNPQQGRMLTVDDPTAGRRHNLNIRPEHFSQEQQRQPLRELTNEEIAEFERAKAESQRNQNAISKTARERIEFLTGIGRIKTDFEMDGVTFHLQSLKDGELENVLDTMISMGDTNEAKFNFELRRQTLARSLASVDNMPIEELISSNDIDHKLDLIRAFDENLVDYMYKHYEEHILKASRNKYAIKTEKDVKEVVEAVKK
ncbi:hypothetical protein LCGC14_0523050 [marine sediment metagenome]|uniref:Uncharacterized protein n=1 Tax=marine sediment metagenome TaxID=412755 RepID=A0A0F9S2Q4_9ZZZZ